MTEQTAPAAPVETAPPPPAIEDHMQVPGSKVTFGDLRMANVPEDVIAQIPAIVQAVQPRRVGLVECNGDWYVYRSLGRFEFKNVVKEATTRITKKAEAAAKANQQLNPAELNAESQSWLEEKIAAVCSILPKLEASEMNEGEAGVPKLVHDAVMARSNFEQTSEPIVL